MTDPLVQLSRVSKSFGELAVLRELDLEVREGEVAALAGGNGSGKSTLLRIIATLVLPDAGTVSVGGVDAVRRDREARRQLGVLLTEERSWYWRLGGAENLRFFGALHGLAGAANRRRVDELLELTGLTEARDRPMGAYSSGMRMRLALARALIGRPRVLLLDEPTRSADLESSLQFRELIRRETDTGVAVVIASHDPAEIADLTTDVTVLKVGAPARRIRIGAADELEHVLLESA